MLSTPPGAWRRAKGLSQDGLIWARNTAVKVVLFAVLITFQLWLAFFMYGTFYYASMPTQLHTKPVYLDFSVCDSFDGTPQCPFPSSNVTLVQDPTSEKLLMPGQKYTIRLEIEMPQSPVNENIGNFMVNLKMFSKTDEITAKSSRPALMKYRSPLLKVVDIMVLAPFFVAGYTEEKQLLNVELMHDFVDNAYKPSVKLSVQLRAKHVQIYSSAIKIHAQFTGLRYLMFYWPLTTAMISVFVNFCFLTILSMLLWRQCVSVFIREQELPEGDAPPAPFMTYEERRRLARQNMETERSNLFRSRPPHVRIVDPNDPASSESSQRESRDQESSEPSTSRGIHRTSSKGSIGSEASDANDDIQIEEEGVETLKGGSSSSSDGGFEQIEREEIIDDEQKGEEEQKREEDENDNDDSVNVSQEQTQPQGILRHRTSTQKD